MASLREADLPEGLSSDEGDLLDLLYLPCLNAATRYRRAAGYFSSGLLALAPLSFADFVRRGGRMQLVCSPHLTKEDLVTLRGDHVPGSVSRARAQADLKDLAEASDLSGALMKALSSLLEAGVLEMRVLLPERRSSRLFHDKIGIFEDDSDRVSFLGSANETVAAWAESGNHENVEVFCSWKSDEDATRISRHLQQFRVAWEGPIGWFPVSQGEIRDLVFSAAPPETVDVSLSRVQDLASRAQRRRKATGDRADAGPPQREPRQLRDYQEAVLEDWRSREHRGIVAFATGGGKTLTAISAVRDQINAGRPSVVLVPSELLHRQWAEEMRLEIPDIELVMFGSGHAVPGRENLLRGAVESGSAVVLTTYATASTPEFLRAFAPSSDLLVVADEVHTAGQPRFREFLADDRPRCRLGLSATPERFSDPEGSAALFDYFGSILEPRFSISDAIEAGALVRYTYDFETVALQDLEFDEWQQLSKEISQAYARSDDSDVSRAHIDWLLQRRARIAKRAAGKPLTAYRVLNERYQKGDRWLVYCSDRAQMDEVRAALARCGLPLYEYHHQMEGARLETIKAFSRHGGVMLAINCLDEGVDIPPINRALILASSTNPRQYIQRRGRVLRPSPETGKTLAGIFDVLVTTPHGDLLTVSEARRALEFTATSESVASRIDLEGLLARSGLNHLVEENDYEEAS